MKITKFLSILLAFIMVLPIYYGCGNKGGEIDSTKTQLYVGNFNGGYGDIWLQKLKERFEETYKDECFEPGTDKKGVQIVIQNGKQTMEGPSLLDTMSVSQIEVFFTEGVEYQQFVAKNLFLDISDIVSEKLPGENKSILDKIDAGQKDYLNINDKYYGIPHYDSYRGIIYDWDLFNERGLFLQEGGGYTDANGALATGPSGIPNGYDAGLPATYQDFFDLCDYMMQQNITPISWSGEYLSTYTGYLLYGLYADCEGADSYNLLNNAGTISGKNSTKIITGFNGDEPILESITISLSNMEELAKQPGRYYSLKFLEEIVKNNWYSTLSSNSTQTQVAAQADFLYSKYQTDSPIAMLVEGQWWMEEASDTFRDMESLYGAEASKISRKFGYMPMPKISTDRLGKPTLIYDTNGSLCFINGNMTDQNKIKLAKEFLKFASTDQSLIEFTTLTGCTKCYNYDLGDEMDSLSYFSRSIYEVSSNSEFAYSYSPSYEVRNQIKEVTPRIKEYYTQIDDNVYNIPAQAFIFKNVNALDYFNGIKVK